MVCIWLILDEKGMIQKCILLPYLGVSMLHQGMVYVTTSSPHSTTYFYLDTKINLIPN